jgi:hypothetical protein
VDDVPEGFDALWRRFSAGFQATIERSAGYMRRRYLAAPYTRYRLVEVRDGDGLVGVAVMRFHPTPAGPANRIVDFCAEPGREEQVWRATLALAGADGAIYSDFIVVGTAQDAALAAAGLVLATPENGLEGVPNLLAPVDFRQWSYSFHLGGAAALGTECWRRPDAVWFTKGDGDRDWPTPYAIENAMVGKQ